jgi:hypothetical protein
VAARGCTSRSRERIRRRSPRSLGSIGGLRVGLERLLLCRCVVRPTAWLGATQGSTLGGHRLGRRQPPPSMSAAPRRSPAGRAWAGFRCPPPRRSAAPRRGGSRAPAAVPTASNSASSAIGSRQRGGCVDAARGPRADQPTRPRGSCRDPADQVVGRADSDPDLVTAEDVDLVSPSGLHRPPRTPSGRRGVARRRSEPAQLAGSSRWWRRPGTGRAQAAGDLARLGQPAIPGPLRRGWPAEKSRPPASTAACGPPLHSDDHGGHHRPNRITRPATPLIAPGVQSGHR